MHVRNGQLINIFEHQIIDNIQYGPNWFQQEGALEDLGIEPVFYVDAPIAPTGKKVIRTGVVKDNQDRWVISYEVVDKTQDELEEEAEQFIAAKQEKNQHINNWRQQANFTSFKHLGKDVACDVLSRSDIDAVANHISLMGTFPPSFPNAWKAMDNSYIPLADVAAFKAMYSSMTSQGTANFARSQARKNTLSTAETPEAVNAIVW